MNTINKQNKKSQSLCCIDYCETIFHTQGEEILNRYRCNQRTFTSANYWRIEKNRRDFRRSQVA